MATLMLACWASLLAAAPLVTTTIRPLQLIAAAVTEGIVVPELALAPGQDPHNLSLRPSERRALAQADLVLWIGPALEQPLAALLGNTEVAVLTVQELDGLVVQQAEDHTDPHIWLDTGNATLIASALAEALAGLDAAHAEDYRRNARDFAATLAAFDAETVALFAGLQAQEWAVYHNAFRYFAGQFKLQSPLTLADGDNNPPGIRSVLALQEALQAGSIHCVLTEPGVNHEELRAMLAPQQPLLLAADVLGTGNGSANTYVELLQAVARQVAACLREAP